MPHCSDSRRLKQASEAEADTGGTGGREQDIRRGGGGRWRRRAQRRPGAGAGPTVGAGGRRRASRATRRPTHVHNYLGRDGTPPAELLAAGRAEVAGYGGEFVAGRVEAATREGDGLPSSPSTTGAPVRARRLLVATGLIDELPDVPGLAERWGRDVLHCPYCHGWEVRDRRIGVLATGPLAVAPGPAVAAVEPGRAAPAAPLPRAGRGGRRAARRPQHRRRADGPVAGLEVTGDALTGVRLASGEVVALDALVVGARARPPAPDVLESLGLKPVEVEMGGHVVGTQIPADADRRDRRARRLGGGQRGRRTRRQVIASAAAGPDRRRGDQRRPHRRGDPRRRRRLPAPGAHDCSRRRPGRSATGPGRRSGAAARTRSSSPRPRELAPGRALDVGSGEGADAVWLAERGWRVTAVDISATALERAAAHAADAGADVAGASSGRTPTCATTARRGRVRPGVGAVHAPARRGTAGAVRPAGRRGGPGRHPADRRAPPVRPADHRRTGCTFRT